jgi:hypothetical protein
VVKLLRETVGIRELVVSPRFAPQPRQDAAEDAWQLSRCVASAEQGLPHTPPVRNFSGSAGFGWELRTYGVDVCSGRITGAVRGGRGGQAAGTEAKIVTGVDDHSLVPADLAVS